MSAVSHIAASYALEDRRPDRVPKKHWRPTYTRGVIVSMLWRGVLYIFDADAQSMTASCGNIDGPDWDPTGGHEIEFRGVRYAAMEPDYPAPPTCPEEPHRIAIEALRGIAHWMRAEGVDLRQVQRAWPAPLAK